MDIPDSEARAIQKWTKSRHPDMQSWYKSKEYYIVYLKDGDHVKYNINVFKKEVDEYV